MDAHRYFTYLFLLVFAMSGSVYSQSPKKSTLEFSGIILDKTSGKKNANVKIIVTDPRTMSIVDSLHTLENGSFRFLLEAQKEFLLSFEKNGYITKKLLLNTSFPNEPNKPSTLFFEIIFPLSDKIASNYGGELIDKPFGKIVFFPSKKIFDYDPVYASAIKRELNKLSGEQTAKLVSGLEFQAEQAACLLSEHKSNSKKNETPTLRTDKTKKEAAKNKTIDDKPAGDATKNQVSTLKSSYVSLPAQTISTKKSSVQKEFFKKEIEKRESGMKKTVLEITDRKKVIYETFLQQKSLQRAALKAKRNTTAKYETNNPLTSFLDATELYEMSLKLQKPIK